MEERLDGGPCIKVKLNEDMHIAMNIKLHRTAYEVEDGKLKEIREDEIYGWLAVNSKTGEVDMLDFRRDDSDLQHSDLLPDWEWKRFVLTLETEEERSGIDRTTLEGIIEDRLATYEYLLQRCQKYLPKDDHSSVTAVVHILEELAVYARRGRVGNKPEQKTPHPQQDRGLLARCETTWNAYYPDRRKWAGIDEAARAEWVRVFSFFDSLTNVSPPKIGDTEGSGGQSV